MDESSLEASLELYRTQLGQVEQALSAVGENEDLLKLRSDLQELVSLTEGCLLSLKKSNLLKSIETVTETPTPTSASVHIDDEYAAFQAALADEDPQTPQNTSYNRAEGVGSRSHSSESPPRPENHTAMTDIFKDIIGTKCRTSYTHEWGAMTSHNAMVVEVDQLSGDLSKVKVMFCNPTHSRMVPCKYYLEGNCRFSEEKCRFSHGHSVEVEELEEFIDPDYSCLRVGSNCLAKYSDDVWYKATVVGELEDHQYEVVYESYDGVHELDIGDILPLQENSSSDEDSDSDSVESTDRIEPKKQPVTDSDSDEEEDALPVFLWRPPKTLQALGEWEEHTRGIASKLMAKMGYIVGQGLGKNGEGRADPIPIQLLPQGKSLDRIMELKEIAGERDIFDVMKKLEKRKKKLEAKALKEKETPRVEKKSGVFDFINKKLGGKKGNLKDLTHRHTHSSSGHSHITEKDLKSRSDRNINVQLLKTHEEIKSAEKEIVRLRQSLSRHKSGDKRMASQVEKKIQSLEQYIYKLQHSESTLQKHQKQRSDHKKLTIF
ncbi:hypothetical protein ScPMuIL_011296 [Solemya velum]